MKRNTVEVVTEDELAQLVKKKKSPVTYCGYELSGQVHIGHMVAASKQLDLQEAGLKVKVLLADVHTRLNRKGSEDWIESMVEYWRECFTGLGFKGEFILGSDFQFKRNYIEDVLELGLKSTLNRALRSMQGIARDTEEAHVSQIIYPLMQVADIKALEVDVAQGGTEQRKIHMLGRELLPDLGYMKPVCIHTPLLVSLQGPESKMSSSKPETVIAVDEEPGSVKNKIKHAYCPPEKEGNPVLQIAELLLFPRLGKIEVTRPEKYGGNLNYELYQQLEEDYLAKKLHPQDLKNGVTENLVKLLEPVREHLQKKGIEYSKPE